MRLDLTRFTVTLTVFLVWTIGTVAIRLGRSVENNWPVVYWIAMLAVSVYWQQQTWDPRWIAGGLAAALFLRFEFMNRGFEVLFRTAEMFGFGYVLWKGLRMLFI